MSQEQFEHTKPRVNVGAIGHGGHGRTTLGAALTTVFAKQYGGRAHGVEEIAGAPEEEAGGARVRISRVGYETPTRHYAHGDWPHHADFAKSVITGAAQPDGAVVVVSAADGPMPHTGEQILLARQAGVPHVVVFLNKCDLVEDEERLEQIEAEVRELLCLYDYPGDTTPVVRGSALRALEGDEEWEARIHELAGYLDSSVPEPVRAVDGPFLLPVEEVSTSPERGTTLTGRVERGRGKAGDEVEIIGATGTRKGTCTGIVRSGRALTEGLAGENIGVLLRTTKHDAADVGQVLAEPGTIKSHRRFEAQLYVLSKDEDGRTIPSLRATALSSPSAPPTPPAPSNCLRGSRRSCPATASR